MKTLLFALLAQHFQAALHHGRGGVGGGGSGHFRLQSAAEWAPKRVQEVGRGAGGADKCLMKVAARGESQVSERCSTWQRACLERADKIGLCRCLCHPQLLSSSPIKLDARSSHPRRAAVMSSLPFPPFAVKGQRRQGRVSMSETCPECSLRGSSRHFCRTSPWRSFCSPPLPAEASRSNRNYWRVGPLWRTSLIDLL